MNISSVYLKNVIRVSTHLLKTQSSRFKYLSLNNYAYYIFYIFYIFCVSLLCKFLYFMQVFIFCLFIFYFYVFYIFLFFIYFLTFHIFTLFYICSSDKPPGSFYFFLLMFILLFHRNGVYCPILKIQVSKLVKKLPEVDLNKSHLCVYDPSIESFLYSE